MPTDIDRLSDLASAASFLADSTCDLSDHAAAARAHYAAWKAAKTSGVQDRPSFGENHLRRATEHDKVATEPESYAQKRVHARAASKKADRGPGVASFRAAATAHDAAATAWSKENPAKGNKVDAVSDPWELRDHKRQAQNYRDQADFIEKKEGDAGASAAKLEAKLGAPAKEEPAPPAKGKTIDARSLARSDSNPGGL